HYLGLADPFGLDTILLTQKLIEICGPDRAFEVLNKSTYPTKQSWLFGYYQSGLSETNPPLSLLCLKFNGLCREPCRTYPIRPQFIPQGCKIIAKFII